jgi:hypothetical protein
MKQLFRSIEPDPDKIAREGGEQQKSNAELHCEVFEIFHGRLVSS